MIFTYKPAGRLRNKYTALAWINKKRNKAHLFKTTPFSVLGHDALKTQIEQSECPVKTPDKGFLYVSGAGYVHIDDCSDFRIIKRVR